MYKSYKQDNVIQEESAKNKPVKGEDLNPAEKYYKDNLEQDEIKFLANAKNSKNNDLEFSKLQEKYLFVKQIRIKNHCPTK